MFEFAIGLPDVDVINVIEKDNSVLVEVRPKNFNRQYRHCQCWHLLLISPRLLLLAFLQAF